MTENSFLYQRSICYVIATMVRKVKNHLAKVGLFNMDVIIDVVIDSHFKRIHNIQYKWLKLNGLPS